MSQSIDEQRAASPALQEERSPSPTPSSNSGGGTAAEQDAYEDAVEDGPARSLTKRPVSTSKPDPSEEPVEDGKGDQLDGATGGKTEVEEDEKNHTVLEGATTTGKDSKPLTDDGAEADSPNTSSFSANRLSNTSNLDNVNLTDDDDTNAAPAAANEPKGTAADEAPPSKTLSLNSIASALPTMPWSPSESPVRSPNPSVTPPAQTSASSAPPPPPSRKLTSPFSWLSRSSSKEKEAAATTGTSTRRNTASSVVTLTSNPETMLSRLDEEGEPNRRASLKDRFKMLRMREEAGITTAMGVEAVNGDGDSGRDVSSQGEISNVPEPDGSLLPGTMSGVNAGPSDAEVDWDLWQSVVYEGPAAVARSSADELNRAIATGIPSAIRGVIWQVLAQSRNDELELTYRELVARGTEKDRSRNSNSTTSSAISNGNLSVHGADGVPSSASSIHSEQLSPQAEKSQEAMLKAQAAASAERKKKEKEEAAALQKLEKAIRRDLGARTSFSKYAAAAGLQDGLYGVCKAFALYDEGVGYAQGMNFLIMPLLFNMPEQEAFCLLVRLMQHYGLRDLFIQDMPGLHMNLYLFERLLEDFVPALYCHLHRRGISPHLYATQWFLTLFSYRFPLQLVLRIYDLILSEGLSAILRFGVVLMQKNATTLLGISDMQQLTAYLKDKLFDVYIDKDPSQGSLLESGFFGSSSSSMEKEVYRADQLVRDACDVKIAPETLKAYKAEWEEKTRLEKERETELYDLRKSNQHLTSKVRYLEERVEVCDREQAALATELVHTKVENEELKDENESLKTQVHELKVVIDKQPQELDEKWKLERDDLLKRNVKVHDENQELEKTLQDLEDQLVQTKMRYAEI
ncbi:hypothetical protein GMORB2_6341 [Geosmithia morbida]|uniref:GTPase-activating protein GYP5 n=1 Tax=Geosmithia morbida TaxID=1094350 RepID=A0A9P4YX26_9HYPO|nr:uncharacterized protein GMORB2_6341 [Geosmithia morbida]KAF4123640.1 hypothetical protein GMORB2_6341 [Geosmithia morbida]